MKKKVSLLALVFLATFAMTSKTVFGLYETPQPWPMWKYDLARSSYTTSTAPNNNQTIWTTANFYPTTIPIVVDGMVIVAGTGSKMYAFDETTGVQLWQSFTFSGSPGGNPAYSNGRIYLGTTNGYLYIINATTGAKLFENQLTSSGQIQTSPAVAYGKVFVGTTDNYLWALNASNLLLKWYYMTGGPIYSSPAIHGDMLYFGCDDDKIYALNIASDTAASLIWRYTTGGDVRSTPCVGGDKVFVGSSSTDHSIFALNATSTLITGQLIWKWTLDAGYAIETSPAFYNEILYVTVPYQKAYALYANVAPGSYPETSPIIKKWGGILVGSYPTTPAIADGKMFFSSGDNKFYALDMDDGHIIWTYAVDYYPYETVVADGRLFATNYYRLYCFGDYYPPLTYYYTVNPLGHTYIIKLVIANATPGTQIDIAQLITQKKIFYNLTGITDTWGMSNITIPNEMLGGTYTVKIDGGAPHTFTVYPGAENTTLYFTYYQSAHTVEIQGTTVIPEFPSTAILPLLMTLSLIAVALAKKKLPRN